MTLNKRAVGTASKYLIMTIFAVILLLPFYWMVLVSFRPTADIQVYPIKWLPYSFTIEHYKEVFTRLDKLLLYFWNTLFLTAVNLGTNLFLCSLAAYAFAKVRFTGHKILFKIMIASMMLPGIVTLVPTWQIVKNMGLINTFAGVLLPGSVGIYGIFFLRQFFITIGDELGEAARIDGARELRIYGQIYLPLILPAIMTLTIFCFQGSWNSYTWPSIVLIMAEDKYPIMVALQTSLPKLGYKFGPMMAASLVVSMPVLIVFIIAQKYFISGIALGGIKG